MSALPIAPPVAGYRFDEAPDLTSPLSRARLSRSALLAFLKIADAWQLTETQKRGLLGGVASSTFHSWRSAAAAPRLSQDELTRISLMIGIYKALHIYFGPAWADRWVTLGNRGAAFAGEAPIEVMIRRGQPGMVDVRRMLDSWRGGR